jgi:hypothetical protein
MFGLEMRFTLKPTFAQTLVQLQKKREFTGGMSAMLADAVITSKCAPRLTVKKKAKKKSA